MISRIRNLTFPTRRGLLTLGGACVCLYAVAVLLYVQAIPDLGLRSIFSTVIKGTPRTLPNAQPEAQESDKLVPQEGDELVEVGDIAIYTWTDLLSAPSLLRERIEAQAALP